MSLLVIGLDEENRWNEIVKEFSDYDVYYLAEYVKAFQIHGDGEPQLIYFNNGNLSAMNVVMKRDISIHKGFSNFLDKDTYFDFATPYGYGGFIFEGKYSKQDVEQLNNEYSVFCKENNIISEFVRLHPVIANGTKVDDMYSVQKLGNTVTIPLHSKKQIWEELNKKNRNVIRKAEKSGVEIYCGRSTKLMEEFIRMYNKTMDKDSAQDYYYFKEEFYESMLKDLKDHFLIFYAQLDESIISMAVIMFCNHQLHYHLSASEQAYQKYAPTNLLLFEAACWGCENGYDTFHLGGGLGSKEDNLYKFKKSFTKCEDTSFFIGKKVFNQEAYEHLCSLNDGTDENFFPRYRAG